MRVWALCALICPLIAAPTKKTCATFGECPSTGEVLYVTNNASTQCLGVCTLAECCIALNLGGQCEVRANCTNYGSCRNITAGMYLDVRGPCGSTNAKPVPNSGTVDDGLAVCLQTADCVGIEADLNADVYYVYSDIEGESQPGLGSSCYRKYASDTDYCVCDPGWGGLDCSEIRKSCEQNCLARGQCDASSGTCLCNSPYSGSYCQQVPPCPPLVNGTNPGAQLCNGYGVCQETGVCQCDASHIGADCGIEVIAHGLSQSQFTALVAVPFFGIMCICVGFAVWIMKGETSD